MLKALSFTTLVLALGVLTAPASAAPVSGLKGIESGTNASAADQVAYRRCWWRYGHRHCRWVDDGYGYGPSIRFRFGDRHYRHRHHGYHHWRQY
jgi:hypothetical protein